MKEPNFTECFDNKFGRCLIIFVRKCLYQAGDYPD